MEIYETISHVSTNQVWLHINSASCRLYISRPIALSSPTFARAGQLARSYLPRLAFASALCHPCPPPAPPRPLAAALLPYPLPYPATPILFSFLIHLTSGMRAIVNPLSYSSPEIVSLNHPQHYPPAGQHGSAPLIAPRYV